VICPMDWGEPSGCDLVFEVTPAVSVNQRRDRMNLSLSVVLLPAYDRLHFFGVI
jgi:hypothetical protein